MEDWQTKIGNLVRETYKQQGYEDVLIMIGGIEPVSKDICTQVFFPFDTAGDFDIRFMVFAVMNHVFSEYNEELNNNQE
jgi:hypothetical protein